MNQPAGPQSPFFWQGKPSIWTRKSDAELEPAPVTDDVVVKPKKPRMPGSAQRLIVDAEAMVAMRRQGYQWRAIANKFDVSLNTCRSRVGEIAPELLGTGAGRVAAPKPASHIVLRTQADADKTARIKGTGVRA